MASLLIRSEMLSKNIEILEKEKSNIIYLDSPATTPCDKRVLKKMEPYFSEFFGNMHSKNHIYGWISEDSVNLARKQIADFLNVEDKEIIFTSGATESNIIAIRGIIDYFRYKTKSNKNHIITSKIEHKSVLSCCKQLEEEGIKIDYLEVDNNGVVNPDDVKNAIRDETALVSIMAVNNETGMIQPIKEIGKICNEFGIAFHSDITQAVGKMEFNIYDANISLASFSSHKIYGPKGIGALFVKRKPSVKMRSFFIGGGQERGIRGGTIPVPLCVGFGEACNILSNEFSIELKRISELNKQLNNGILNNIPLSKLNGNINNKVPHISSYAFPFVEGESIIIGLENICVSTGSACSSTTLEPSYVLSAMSVDEFSKQSSIRFGLSRFTTKNEIDCTVDKLKNVINKLREMSPLWDMYKDGIDFDKIEWK